MSPLRIEVCSECGNATGNMRYRPEGAHQPYGLCDSCQEGFDEQIDRPDEWEYDEELGGYYGPLTDEQRAAVLAQREAEQRANRPTAQEPVPYIDLNPNPNPAVVRAINEAHTLALPFDLTPAPPITGERQCPDCGDRYDPLLHVGCPGCAFAEDVDEW